MPLTSLLQTLESGIIHQLRLAMDPIGVDVQAFPASPLDFEMAPYRSQIFFSMQRRRFDPPERVGSVRRDFSQRMTIEWGLQAEFVNLSSHSGVYQILDRCWLSLSGYSPAYTGDLEGLNRVVSFEPMVSLTESFTGLAEGIYTYNQTWTMGVMAYIETDGPTPFQLDEIRIGLHRAKADDLEDSVLDQELDYTVP
jgi:hypothetical protein